MRCKSDKGKNRKGKFSTKKKEHKRASDIRRLRTHPIACLLRKKNQLSKVLSMFVSVRARCGRCGLAKGLHYSCFTQQTKADITPFPIAKQLKEKKTRMRIYRQCINNE